MTPHNDVVQNISAAFSRRGFHVEIHGNNLPTDSGRNEAIYRPDMIVRKKKDEDITWLVEVETSAAGKAFAGAIISADVCMNIMIEKRKQRQKPGIMFIFYRPKANLELANKRLEALTQKSKISHLEPIWIMNEETALKRINEM